MSEPTLIAEEAGRDEVLRQLDAWSAQRRPYHEEPPGARRERQLLDAIREGQPGAWAALCDFLFQTDLARDMRQTRSGLWSHCRLAAGPTWQGAPVITRALTSYITAQPGWYESSGDRRWPFGVGSLTIDEKNLWIADHLLYGCQEVLEMGTDCRFYGVADDPDFSGILAERFRWSVAQKRWFTRMSGSQQEAQWLTSARWMFPIPAHAIPVQSLTDPLGKQLWSRALDVASLCPATVTKKPGMWWKDRSLVPDPAAAAAWASTSPRFGAGTISLDALVSRHPGDPCILPAILSVCSPGAQHASEQFATLLDLLLQQMWLTNAMGSVATTRERDRYEAVLPGGRDRLIIERGDDWWCVNGWAMSKALAQAQLVPSYSHYLGLIDWPPSTLLRSGLAEIMSSHAIPVLPLSRDGLAPERVDDLGSLCWCWTAQGRPHIPTGYAAMDLEVIRDALARPGWIEAEGGTTYEGMVLSSA